MRLLGVFLCFLAAVCSAAQISGKVFDAKSGKALAGVLVTNQLDVVKTDAAGKYTLPRHADTRFVSVVMPADRKAEKHYRILGSESPDFALEKRPVRKSFSFLQIGDTETFSNTRCLEEIRKHAVDTDCAFLLHTGDICREKGIAFHAEKLNRKTAGRPVYYSIGNHDFCKGEYGEQFFEKHFGPVCYGFEEGELLFVITPMHTGDTRSGFTNANVAQFVENMLKNIPKDKKLVLVNHYNWLVRHPGKFGVPGKFADLSGHNFKALFYGHTHRHNVTLWEKGKQYSTGMSSGGGGGNSIGAFRRCMVDEKGNITTEIYPLYVKDLLHTVISPAPDADGKHQVAVVCYDTCDVVKNVTCSTGGKSITLKKVSPWQYSGKISLSGKKGNVTVTAGFVSGKKLSKTTAYPAKVSGRSPFELQRVISLPGLHLLGTPLVENGVLYAALSDDGNAENGGVAAFRIKDGKRLWFHRQKFSVRGSLALVKGFIYGCDSRGVRIKLDAATGKLIELVEPFKHYKNYGGVRRLGDYIVSGTEYALTVSDLDGKVLWQATDKNMRKFPGAISLGIDGFGTTCRLILRDGVLYEAINWRKITARRISDGKILWMYPPVRRGLLTPTIGMTSKGKIVLTSAAFNALIDPATGKELAVNKSYSIRGASASEPVSANGRIFFGMLRGGFGAMDEDTLKICWTAGNKIGTAMIASCQYATPANTVDSNPVLWKDGIIASAMDGNCYYLAQKDGRVRWKLPHGAPLMATPVLKDGLLIQADYSGRVFIWKYTDKPQNSAGDDKKNAETDNSIYPNPGFRHTVRGDGKVYLHSHWYSEKISMEGSFRDHPAVKLVPLKYSWGTSGVVGTGNLKLAPGRYRFSVWCKYDKKDAKDIDKFQLIRRYPVNGKTQNPFRRYSAKDMPAPDKWSQLIYEFEVKAGDAASSLLFGHGGPRGANRAAAFYAAPCLVKIDKEK